MTELILIGYWHSKYEPDWPDPAWFVDDKLTDAEIKMTVDYLKNGCFMPYLMLGRSWCRFHCEEKYLGSKEQTDGRYLWPEKLWHYIERHKVRLPHEFIANIKEGRKMPHSFNDKFSTNSDWWRNQKGWDQSKSSYLTEE